MVLPQSAVVKRPAQLCPLFSEGWLCKESESLLFIVGLPQLILCGSLLSIFVTLFLGVAEPSLACCDIPWPSIMKCEGPRNKQAVFFPLLQRHIP